MAKVTLQKRGIISLGKELIEKVGAQEGDRFEADIDVDGNIILKPLVEIPRDQLWFWTEKWQKEMIQARKEVKSGEADEAMPIDRLLQDLDDGNDVTEGE